MRKNRLPIKLALTVKSILYAIGRFEDIIKHGIFTQIRNF